MARQQSRTKPRNFPLYKPGGGNGADNILEETDIIALDPGQSKARVQRCVYTLVACDALFIFDPFECGGFSSMVNMPTIIMAKCV